MPPIIKINGPVLSSVMGAALATKRTTAERLAPGIDPDALVFESYANPFRTYPLKDDYEKFKKLFEERNVDCYVLNTGFLMDKNIPKEVTLECIEAVVEGKAAFKQWADFKDIEIMEIDGFVPDMDDAEYKTTLMARLTDRYMFIKSRDTEKGGYDALPEEAAKAMKKVLSQI